MKEIHGILLVDKPQGMLSREVVDRLGARLRVRRIGHAGTLDPNATGLFLVLVGHATKLSRFLMEGRKGYRATIRLGMATDTYDREGRVIATADCSGVTLEAIRKELEHFRGMILQSPPPFAAVKHQGMRLYKYARKGELIRLPPRQVTIYSLEILSWSNPDLVIAVQCSKGTYLRSLAHDLGERLGVYAHLYEIRRTESEPYHVQQATPWSLLETLTLPELCTRIIPVDRALPHLPRVELPAEGDLYLRYGKPIPLSLLLPRLPGDLQRGAYLQVLSPRWLAILRLLHPSSLLLSRAEGVGYPFRYERILPR